MSPSQLLDGNKSHTLAFWDIGGGGGGGGGGVGVLAVHRLRSGREFLKQYLAEKQNDYIQSGRLWEVLAYE